MAINRRGKLKVKGKDKTLEKKKSKLASYMLKGLNVNDACILAKVSQISLGIFRSDPEFEEFLQECDLKYEMDHLENIRDAAECGAWQASAWTLERKYPEKYGKQNTVKVEYQVKLQNFQQAVLEIINEVSPDLKLKIMKRLKGIDINTPKLIVAPNASDTVEAEYDE